MRTDTAHLAWNDRWASETGRAEWLKPDPFVAAFSKKLTADGRKNVLDLGCGVGRHALHYARLGHHVTAMDMASEGLEQVRASAGAEGLAVATELAAMTELPFADKSFDHVLSFNVIYHGDGTIVQKAIDEIARVLKPGGIFQGTMLSKRNAKYGMGDEVAPNTFVDPVLDPDDSDKMHPHFYCNAAELVELFSAFELSSLEDCQHSKPDSWHWHLLAKRR